MATKLACHLEVGDKVKIGKQVFKVAVVNRGLFPGTVVVVYSNRVSADYVFNQPLEVE